MTQKIPLLALTLATACLRAQSVDTAPAELAPVAVYSERVANQEEVSTFSMPISSLSFEPGVDVQARNLAEGQADVSIRGGTFENTGFRIGAVGLYDPQTGHYLAEIPVAPVMLQAPELLLGSDNALYGFNANAGTVAYGWRPIRTAGSATVGWGEDDTWRQEFYYGYVRPLGNTGLKLGADVSVAHAQSDGTVAYGDHDFDRSNVRLQLRGEDQQTDLFAGYQAKFFSWPNLYTPFGVIETENLQTVLVALNHRRTWGSDNWLEAGAYWRRNKDDYVYNRLSPKGLYQHTSWSRGLSLAGRNELPVLTLNYSAQFASDRLKSTTLNYGYYHSRTYVKLGVVPEKSWELADRQKFTVKTGVTFDDTNRDRSALSPVVEFAHETPTGNGTTRRIYLSYAKTTQVATYTALNANAAAGLFRGNPDLGRETSHNYELGVSQMAFGWRLKTAVFYRYDDQLVDWTFTNGVTARRANAVDIGNTGFELMAQRSWKRLDFVLGYTGLTKDADYGVVNIDGSFYALNYPKHRVTAALVARLGWGFELRADNEFRKQADNPLRVAHGDTAFLTTAGLSYRPEWLPQLIVAAQVSNLWDDEFQEVPAVPAARRQCSLSTTYSW